jgi:secreted PhoX family phosphatase
MRRRDFLRAVSVSSGAAVLAPALWRPAVAASRQAGAEGPYGSIERRQPDENGLLLPEGFTSRVLARSDEVVEGTDYTWPVFPDGAATFPLDAGGWYLAVNTENPLEGEGGASGIELDPDGEVVGAHRILEGTTMNCAGGPTPWGAWLSCEEIEGGLVWECDPSGQTTAEARPALGAFPHEAVTVDPDAEHLYLTEDRPDGRFYRFTPDTYPDLTAGALEVAQVAEGGTVTWLEVPDPSATDTTTREQVPESTPFNGGEGIWFDDGSVYFSSKGDNNVRRYDTEAETLEVIYDGSGDLTGVDNITVEPGTSDLYVAEDGGNMEIVLLTPEGEATPFLRIVDEGVPADGLPSEITGPAFSPDGTTLYFGSQRGGPSNAGVSYAVSGPFRAADAATTSTTQTTLAGVASSVATASGGDTDGDDDGGSDLALPLVGGAMVLGLAATGALVWRVRNRSTSPGDDESGPPTSG